MRRKRRSAQKGDFEDPLKDYSPATYADETERRLCEATLDEMQTTPFMTVGVDQTVEQTLRIMAEKNIAYLMVTDQDRLVGIFSERDVLYKVALRYQEIKNQPISEVMTANPVWVHETDSPAKALNLMAVGGFRHLPILSLDEKIVGVLGPRRVTAYLCRHFANQ